MPAMSFSFVPRPRHFGLSIGRTSLRGVEVVRGKITAAVEIEIPEGIFNNGVVTDKKSFLTQLKKLLEMGKFTTQYVGVCFSEELAYSREYSVPPIPLDEVREAISWHVKDLFPFPQEEIYFDWKLLEKSETEFKLAVVAVQRNVIDSQFAVLVEAGLKPLGFQPGAATIAQLINLENGQLALIVEINKRGAYVTLLEEKKVLFTTVVNYSAADTPELYLGNITQTISEIANYYTQKGIITNSKIPIILTGDLATEEWASNCAARISNPVQILKTAISKPQFNKAYAMAISTIEPPADPGTINLLPEAIQTFYDKERSVAYYKTFLLRSCSLLFVLCFVSIAAFMLVTFERQRLDQRVKTLTAVVKNQNPNMQRLLLLNSQSKNIVQLAPLRVTPSDKLLVLQNILPETIVITQWDYNDAKLEYVLAGDAQSRVDLLNFKNKLEKTGEFAKILLPLDSLESAQNAHFSVTFLSKL